MIWNILLTLLLVLINGLFVAAEFAIVKVRISQVETKLASGNKLAKGALRIINNLDAYLSATQLGITLASLGLGWIGESVATEVIIKGLALFNQTISLEAAHKIAFPVSFAVITFMHIVFGELAPKSIAIRYPESTTMALAYPLRAFYVVFKPFIWGLNGVANLFLRLLGIPLLHEQDSHTEDEIRILLEQSKESGIIKSTEHELLENVFKFDDRIAQQIMIPRTKIAAIDVSISCQEALEKIIEDGYSRVPVFKDTIDNIIGILYAKDLIKNINKNKVACSIQEVARAAYSVPEKKRISELLREMQRQHIQMAVLLDEFGGTAGIVTMEDIIEEIVGDIQDEYDEEAPIVEAKGKNEFIINALSNIGDVNKHLPYPLPESEHYETVAGLLNVIFGKIPNISEEVTHDKFNFKVLKKSNNTVESVLLRITRAASDNDENPIEVESI